MAKIKVLKKLPKSKIKPNKSKKINHVQPEANRFKDKYFEFYDDIKTPTKRYDW